MTFSQLINLRNQISFPRSFYYAGFLLLLLLLIQLYVLICQSIIRGAVVRDKRWSGCHLDNNAIIENADQIRPLCLLI